MYICMYVCNYVKIPITLYIFYFADNDGDSQEVGPSGLRNTSTGTGDGDDDDDDYNDVRDGTRFDMFYIRTSTPEKTNPPYSTNSQNKGTYYSLQITT